MRRTILLLLLFFASSIPGYAQSNSTPPPPCWPPTNLTVTSITGTSATISWTDTNGYVTWDILVQPAGGPWPDPFVTPTYANITGNSYVISGLDCTQDYDVYVKATDDQCFAGFAIWSNPLNVALVSTWDGTSWSPAPPTGTSGLVFVGNYSSTGNLSGCSCRVASGNVVFNSGDALILDGALTVDTGATLVFEDSANLIQTDDAAINSGQVMYKRTTTPMYRYDYTYWGSPVTLASGYTLGTLSPDTLSDKYYSWIPTVGDGYSIWQQESVATVMDPARGYIVRAPQSFSADPLTKAPYTGIFIGTPNNGIVTTPIWHGTVPSPDYKDDYNLIANPYPSALDAELLLSDPANVAVLDGTLHFWTHNSPISIANPDPFYGDYIYNYAANDYASWNKMGGTGTTSAAGSGGAAPNGSIGAGQSFFVRAMGAPTGTLATFRNAMRTTSNSQFFRSVQNQDTGIERHRMWLNLVGDGGSFNQLMFGYAQGATMGWDRGYDGSPFSENAAIEFYSVLDGQPVVIQGRALPFDAQDVVPIGWVTDVPHEFSIRIQQHDPLFDGQNIFVEDLKLGIVHDLKQSPYTFFAEAGRTDDRLRIKYINTPLARAQQTFITTDVYLYRQQLKAQSNQPIASIAVYDISGKSILRFDEIGQRQFATPFDLPNGVYVIRVTTVEGQTTVKKIVN